MPNDTDDVEIVGESHEPGALLFDPFTTVQGGKSMPSIQSIWSIGILFFGPRVRGKRIYILLVLIGAGGTLDLGGGECV